MDHPVAVVSSAAIALRLPRLRRLQRPPACLVLLVLELILDMVWLGVSLLWWRHHSPLVAGISAAIWMWLLRRDHHKLLQCLVAWRMGARLRTVSLFEWVWVVSFLAWGLLEFILILG
jgi:hypothetical protein